MTSVEPLDGPLLRLGSRYRIIQPRLRAATWVVTALEPPLRFAWEVRSPGLRVVADHIIDELPSGRSTVILRVSSSGLIGTVLGRLTRSITQRYLAREAHALKLELEGANAGAAKRDPVPTQHRPVRLPMPDSAKPVALVASEAPRRAKASNYPEPFASAMAGREKRPLGDLFGLTNFGVNLTRLAPKAVSALRHAHTKQDEFIYILQGHPLLHTDEGSTQLSPGMCAGFKAGTGNAHRLINESVQDVVYLEVGDRTPGDKGSYPDDDLKALLVEGKWQFIHKNGAPYK